MTDPPLTALCDRLLQVGAAAVAVSDGIDSMMLACMVQRTRGDNVEMINAVSPAVPPTATARVCRYVQQDH
jgi:uncharacterized protein